MRFIVGVAVCHLEEICDFLLHLASQTLSPLSPNMNTEPFRLFSQKTHILENFKVIRKFSNMKTWAGPKILLGVVAQETLGGGKREQQSGRLLLIND